jgi:hypothetical protein
MKGKLFLEWYGQQRDTVKGILAIFEGEPKNKEVVDL